MTQPPAGYPPVQMSYVAQPQAVPRHPASPRWTAGLLAGLALLVATGATVWGSFGILQSYQLEIGRDGDDPRVTGYEMTWWEFTPRNGEPDSTFPPFGLLLVVAAVLLVVAAVLALSAFGRLSQGVVTAARATTALGAGLVAGVVAVQLMYALGGLSEFNEREVDPGESSSFELGLGVWLPGGAAVVALIALVLTLTRPKTALARVEPDTPRMGVPMPYGQQPYPGQQPAQQQQQYYPQQPGTGQHYPVPQPTPPQQPQPTPPQQAQPQQQPQPPEHTAEPATPQPQAQEQAQPAAERKPGDQPEN